MAVCILDVAHIVARPLIAFVIGVGRDIAMAKRYLTLLHRNPSSATLERMEWPMIKAGRTVDLVDAHRSMKYIGRCIWACTGLMQTLKVWYDLRRLKDFYRLKGRRQLPVFGGSRRNLHIRGIRIL